METPVRKFSCPIGALYISGRLAWEFCEQNMADFTAFRAKYTPGLVAQRLAAIQAAEGITDVNVRNAGSKKARIALEAAIATTCDNWQELKRYIINASRPMDRVVNVKAAGGESYVKAAQGNWQAASTLVSNATMFIAANTSFLQADDNMPATFPAVFEDSGTACKSLAATFFEASRNKPLTAAEKAQANNDIYSDLGALFADAQRIYRKNEPLRRQFTMAYVLRLARGTRPGGIKGGITDYITGKPIPGATITILDENKQKVSDKKGRYDFRQMAAGIYQLSVEAVNYKPVTMQVTVKPGVSSRASMVVQSAIIAMPALVEKMVANEAGTVVEMEAPATEKQLSESDMKVA